MKKQWVAILLVVSMLLPNFSMLVRAENEGDVSEIMTCDNLSVSANIINDADHDMDYAIDNEQSISGNSVYKEQESSIQENITLETVSANQIVKKSNMKDGNTYYVSTADELIEIADKVNAGDDFNNQTISIVNDINLKNVEWPIIGNSENNPFRGSIDGNGHIIKNIKTSYKDYSGLIGYMIPSEASSIRNIIIENADIQGRRTGGLIGVVKCLSNSNILLDECIVSGSITGMGNTTGTESYGTGGLIGIIYSETNSNVEINKCRNNATIYSSLSDSCSGGLIGNVVNYCENSFLKIYQCFNRGEVEAYATYGYSCISVGGLIGSLQCSEAEIDQCFNNGSVSGTGYYTRVGGLIGNIDVNTITVFNLKNSYVNTQIKSTCTNGSSQAGGLIGHVANGSFKAGEIENCYVTGNLSANNRAGLICWYEPSDEMTIRNCYFDSTKYGLQANRLVCRLGMFSTDWLTGKVYNSSGMSTSDMKNSITYLNWEWETIWMIDDNFNDGYPYHRWYISPLFQKPSLNDGKSIWSCIYFGHYYQNGTVGDESNYGSSEKNSIKWRIVSLNGTEALLISDKAIEWKQYNKSDNEINTWETSDIRKWLNETFIDSCFSEDEQKALKDINFVVSDDESQMISDKVILPSIKHVTTESYGFITDANTETSTRECLYTKYLIDRGAFTEYGSDIGRWYLLDTNSKSGKVAVVDYDGTIDTTSYSSITYSGIRPMILLDLSNIDLYNYAGTVDSLGQVIETKEGINIIYLYPHFEISVGSSASIGIGIDDFTNGKYEFDLSLQDEDIAQIERTSPYFNGIQVTLKGIKEGKTILTAMRKDTGEYVDIPIYVDKGIILYTTDYVINNSYIYGLGMYMDNFSVKSSKDNYLISFDVYNTLGLYGAVEIYDQKGNLIGIEEIKKSDCNWVTGIKDVLDDVMGLLRHTFNGTLLTYKYNSQQTTFSDLKVPKGGYIEISNNCGYSFGAAVYNCVDLLFFALLSKHNIGNIGEDIRNAEVYEKITGKILKDAITSKVYTSFADNFKKIFYKSIGKQVTIEAVETGAPSLLDDCKILLTNDLDIDLIKEIKSASISAGISIGEGVFEKLSGPIGPILKSFFTVHKYLKFGTQIIHINQQMSGDTAMKIQTYAENGNLISNDIEVKVPEGNFVLETKRISSEFNINDAKKELEAEKIEVYEVLLYENGIEVHEVLNGEMKVYMPIPDGFDAKSSAVYRQESDGSYTDMQAQVENQKLAFLTDHFSIYVIAEKQIHEKILYNLMVHSGNGSGKYYAGDEVTIQAIVNENETFNEWTIIQGNLNLKNKNSKITSFIMPAEDVEINAVLYVNDNDETKGDDNGSGNGSGIGNDSNSGNGSSTGNNNISGSGSSIGDDNNSEKRPNTENGDADGQKQNTQENTNINSIKNSEQNILSHQSEPTNKGVKDNNILNNTEQTPQTGDETNVIVWITLLMILIFGLLIILKRDMKNKVFR